MWLFVFPSMADFTKGTLLHSPVRHLSESHSPPACLFYAALLVSTGRLVSDGHSDSDYQQGFVLTLFSDVG